MPVECRELQKSRRITFGESADYYYIVTGTDAETAALAAALATAPATVASDGRTLQRQPAELEPVLVDGERSLYEVHVPYKIAGSEKTNADGNPQPPLQPNDSTFQFDTTGGTQHITQSEATVGAYGVNPADHCGGIGFDGENFQGTDITVPVFKFSETHYFAPGAVTPEFTFNLFFTTGKVNADAFREYDPGEVLFLGAVGARRGRHRDDLWEITFHFAASKNRTLLEVGGITVDDKLGWEYLWVEYEPFIDVAAKARSKRPRAVYVERVYLLTEFQGLGI